MFESQKEEEPIVEVREQVHQNYEPEYVKEYEEEVVEEYAEEVVEEFALEPVEIEFHPIERFFDFGQQLRDHTIMPEYSEGEKFWEIKTCYYKEWEKDWFVPEIITIEPPKKDSHTSLDAKEKSHKYPHEIQALEDFAYQKPAPPPAPRPRVVNFCGTVNPTVMMINYRSTNKQSWPTFLKIEIIRIKVGNGGRNNKSFDTTSFDNKSGHIGNPNSLQNYEEEETL